MSNRTLSRYRPRSGFQSLMRLAQNPEQRRRYARFLGRTMMRARRPAGRAQTMTQQRRPTFRSGILGGTNADQRMIYRRKRMPRKKRRNWVRFVKKVNAVDERDLGSQTVVFNDQISQRTGAVIGGTQACLTLALYPFTNGTNLWLNDMAAIHALDNVANPTAAAGTSTYSSTKYMFHSAVLDVTIRNVSTLAQGDPLVDNLSPDAALELDIYTVALRKDAADFSIRFASMSSLFNSYDDPEIGGTGTGYSIQDRGLSPFEFGSQMGRFGCKILKKQKFFIPNGQTITFQTRDPKRHVIMKDRLIENDGWNRPGWTQVYYMIYKLVPGLPQGTTIGTYRAGITCGVTRKYLYKLEGRTEARERLLGATYVPGNPN